MKKIILFSAISVNSFFASAYSSANHTLITQYAIDLLNKKFGAGYISPVEAKAIIKGNCSEDQPGVKWVTRYWNQHFYNPLKSVKYWRRSKSIDVRFERIAKRCFKRLASRKYYYSMGEIVHHIQDYTNPAHVVPVYHGGTLKDSFDEHHVSCCFPVNPVLDTNITYSEPYLVSILKPVALKTLENIHDQFEIQMHVNGNPVSKIVDWSYFWKDNPAGWFGHYGFLGASNKAKGKRRDNYFNDKIYQVDTLYSVNKKIYEDFSSKQLEIAVVETARFIYYAKRLLEKNMINNNK